MLDPERGQGQGIVTRGPGSADRDALDDAVTPGVRWGLTGLTRTSSWMLLMTLMELHATVELRNSSAAGPVRPQLKGS